MSTYLDRLKQLEAEKNVLHTLHTLPPKPSKGAFGGFDGTPKGVNVKNFSNDEKLHEARQEKVMALLQANPDVPRAVYADTDSDPLNVILAIAVRHVAVTEMTIPREKYDPWRLMTVLDGEVH